MSLTLIPRPGVRGPNGEPILMFSNQAIQAQLDSAYASLGDHDLVATITYQKPDAAPGVLGLAAAWKIGDEWSVMGAFQHSSQGTMVAAQVAWRDGLHG